jgi:hypothetical protein
MGRWADGGREGERELGSGVVQAWAWILIISLTFSVTSVTKSVAELPSSIHPLHPLQNPLPNFLPSLIFVFFKRISQFLSGGPESRVDREASHCHQTQAQ